MSDELAGTITERVCVVYWYSFSNPNTSDLARPPTSAGVWCLNVECLKVFDIISGPDRWQGSGVSPSAGGKNVWPFFFFIFSFFSPFFIFFIYVPARFFHLRSIYVPCGA